MHLYAQLIDDDRGFTLLGLSTTGVGEGKGSNIAGASHLGQMIAHKAKEKGITKVVFDRGGYRFHGVVKAFAESARGGGLEF